MHNILRKLVKSFIYLSELLNFKSLGVRKLTYSLGLYSLLASRNHYDNIRNISEAEVKVYSQNGEDGIIDYLINRLGVLKPNFVEIGVGQYIEANTRFLYERFYPKGLIVDCEENLEKKVFKNVNEWKGDLKVVEKFINSENIVSIMEKGINFEVDLFSVDIDGIDYWIIEKIPSDISKIFIAEYNAVFGDKFDISVPNLNNFNRKNYHHSHLCYGMSLKALIRIMKKKGYYFIGTNSFKNNAFFINMNYKKDIYFKNIQNISDSNLKDFTNSNYRESRDKNGKLNFLSDDKRLDQIKDCEIIDFTDNNGTLKKIKDLKDF